VPKLFICYTQDTDTASGRDKGLHSLDVNIGVLSTGTVPYVDGKLKHGKSIALQIFSKVCVTLLFFLGFCWKVEEDKYPHDTIFTETVHVYFSG
jgi:hypothetical protein